MIFLPDHQNTYNIFTMIMLYHRKFLIPNLRWQEVKTLWHPAHQLYGSATQTSWTTSSIYLKPWQVPYSKIDLSVCTLLQLLSSTKALFSLFFLVENQTLLPPPPSLVENSTIFFNPSLIWAKLFFEENAYKYQPSGPGGTRSPPATPHRLQHLTARLFQNGRQGLERV